MPEQFNATPRAIIQHFSPAWFASVMGTAVIPLALAFVDAFWVKPISIAFLVLSILLFLVSLLTLTSKMILFPGNVKMDLNHPITANFYPTMPISLILLSLNIMRFPTLFFSEKVSLSLAYYLWLIGAVGIYVMGFVILTHIFRHQEIKLQHANFGWYIPPVSKLIITAVGLEMATTLPNHAELAITLSFASLGVGFFLFLFVGSAVYQRYIYHELPMSRMAATFFIGSAPVAILAVIISKMIQLLASNVWLGDSVGSFAVIGKIGILVTWGFAAWWFVMAMIVTAYYLWKIELPYALSWWAFTFPSGAVCLASGVAWKVSGFSSIQYFYFAALLFLVTVWTIVTVKTASGVISRKIFAPMG